MSISLYVMLSYKRSGTRGFPAPVTSHWTGLDYVLRLHRPAKVTDSSSASTVLSLLSEMKLKLTGNKTYYPFSHN